MQQPKDSVYWLDRVKVERGIESDAELARVLKTTRAAISQQRVKKNEMSLKTAIRVAWMLNIEALEVIGSVMYHSEKPEHRVFWLEVIQRAKQKKANYPYPKPARRQKTVRGDQSPEEDLDQVTPQ